MNRREAIISSRVLAVVLCYCLSVVFLIGADSIRKEEGMDEILYLPNEKLLSYFTGGLNTIIADMLWLNCIQYTAKEHRGKRHFTWLEHMVQTATRLDPYFVDVYRFGAIFLAALRADPEASLRLARAGIAQNPHSWHLPYEAAMTYLMNKRDDPNARYFAAQYLSMSIATGNAPGGIVNLTAKLQDEFDLTELERDTWLQMSKSDDSFLRELAERKLEEMELRKYCKILNDCVQLYCRRHGKAPNSLEDLVADKILKYVPDDPLGGRFFLGIDGIVYNTTLLDDAVIRNRNPIINALHAYYQRNQSYPAQLEDLVHQGFLKSIPNHPYPGREWAYNPQTGGVE